MRLNAFLLAKHLASFTGVSDALVNKLMSAEMATGPEVLLTVTTRILYDELGR